MHAATTERLRSVQMDDKLIFFDGINPNFYTTDASAFTRLEAVVVRGAAGADAGNTTLQDADVTSWVIDTDTVINDLNHNITQDGYGVISALNTASATHTLIGTAGEGIGKTSANQA
ncbi:MAG: hypothetical protein IIC62_04105, partial [Proteobacteria bacterium]|nr:hypothetical protein [Pseudomonadota bacterium]